MKPKYCTFGAFREWLNKHKAHTCGDYVAVFGSMQVEGSKRMVQLRSLTSDSYAELLREIENKVCHLRFNKRAGNKLTDVNLLFYDEAGRAVRFWMRVQLDIDSVISELELVPASDCIVISVSDKRVFVAETVNEALELLQPVLLQVFTTPGLTFTTRTIHIPQDFKQYLA